MWRFSLRDLLFASICLAAVLGWWAERRRATQTHREIIEQYEFESRLPGIIFDHANTAVIPVYRDGKYAGCYLLDTDIPADSKERWFAFAENSARFYTAIDPIDDFEKSPQAAFVLSTVYGEMVPHPVDRDRKRFRPLEIAEQSDWNKVHPPNPARPSWRRLGVMPMEEHHPKKKKE